MNIALIGYGKMGKAIEEIAIGKGHRIVLKVNQMNAEHFTMSDLKQADVAIEFTTPDTSVHFLKQCFDAQIPVVCGTTGWLHQMDEVLTYCKEKNGTFLYASNFSVGVNIFFELNRRLATLMSLHADYDVAMEEIHHTQKKDAPSGTAITLANDILEIRKDMERWVSGSASDSHELGIVSKREDPAPGTHTIAYRSEIDSIEIRHTAFNRKGFATGAVLAASFLLGKKGVFTMQDILQLGK